MILRGNFGFGASSLPQDIDVADFEALLGPMVVTLLIGGDNASAVMHKHQSARVQPNTEQKPATRFGGKARPRFSTDYPRSVATSSRQSFHINFHTLSNFKRLVKQFLFRLRLFLTRNRKGNKRTTPKVSNAHRSRAPASKFVRNY